MRDDWPITSLRRHFNEVFHPKLTPKADRTEAELDVVRREFSGDEIRGPSEKSLFDAGYALGRADQQASTYNPAHDIGVWLGTITHDSSAELETCLRLLQQSVELFTCEGRDSDRQLVLKRIDEMRALIFSRRLVIK